LGNEKNASYFLKKATLNFALFLPFQEILLSVFERIKTRKCQSKSLRYKNFNATSKQFDPHCAVSEV